MKDIHYLSIFPPQSKIPDPEGSGKLLTVTNDIVATFRMTDIFYGDVKYSRAPNGTRVLDLTSLIDLTPDTKDIPVGVQMRVMACDLTAPMLPVEFRYKQVHYRGVWVKAEDLFFVSGIERHRTIFELTDQEKEAKRV